MVRLIAWHTVRQNLLDLRTVALLGVMFACFVVSGLASSRALTRQRQQTFALQQKASEKSDLQAAILVRPTNPLDFVQADDRGRPAYLVVSPEMVDYPLENAATRELSPAVSAFDWAFIMKLVVCLACLLMTFDSISGQAERGTLRLLIATGASRRAYYLGVVLGSFSTLLPILLLCCLVSLLPVVAAAGGLDSSQYLRLGGVFCCMALLCLLFVLLGVLASALAARSETSLLIALSFWIGFALLIPLGGVVLSEWLAKPPPAHELDEKLRAAQTTLFHQKHRLDSVDITRINERKDFSRSEKETALKRLQDDIDREDAVAFTSYTRHVREIREDFLRRLRHQVELGETLASLSPLYAYQRVCSAVLGNGSYGQQDFERAADRYRARFAAYADPLREQRRAAASRSENIISDGDLSIRSTRGISFAGVPFDRAGYPRFQYQLPSLATDLERATAPALLLCFSCLGAFVAGLFLVIRYRWV